MSSQGRRTHRLRVREPDSRRARRGASPSRLSCGPELFYRPPRERWSSPRDCSGRATAPRRPGQGDGTRSTGAGPEPSAMPDVWYPGPLSVVVLVAGISPCCGAGRALSSRARRFSRRPGRPVDFVGSAPASPPQGQAAERSPDPSSTGAVQVFMFDGDRL